MFRYRCPQCDQLLQALEMRAGKTTVCSKCSRPLTIPADRADWLDEHGEPLQTQDPASAIISGGSSNVLSADAVRRTTHLPSFNPLDEFDVHAPIVLGDDDGVVNLTPPGVVPPPPPPQPLAPPPARKVYEATPTPAPRPAPTRAPAPTPAARPSPVPAPAAEVPPAPVPAASPNGTKKPEPDWGGVRDQLPKRPGRVVATTPAPPPSRPAPLAPRAVAPARPPEAPPRGDNWPENDPDAVSFSDPLKLRSQMDIAADLSMVLSTRMKPPPEPPRDLNPSTAAWLLLTGLAVLLLVLSMVTQADYLWGAGFVGAVEVAVGYVWIVWMTFRRGWQRGVACAIPPVTFYYLFQKKYARFRPLRFVLTGAAIIGVALMAVKAQDRTRAWSGATAPPVAEPPPDVSKQSKLVQLREYREQRNYGPLLVVLRSLAGTDHDFSKEATQRGELAAELKALCSHQLSDVKVEALAAYTRWALDEADALRLCLAALRSSNPEERMTGIRLLPKWKDGPAASSIASAIASRLGRVSPETNCARDALVEIGGAAAEQAVIPILEAEDQQTRTVAIDLLEKVGGPLSVEALLDQRKTTLHQDPATSKRAAAKAAAIKERLYKKK
ncbi:MAG TPA: hypothetical protein VMZ71_02145 [Gemmataceae bacterium]|nr:hypothetical protein [Gemmataceae bacterium]